MRKFCPTCHQDLDEEQRYGFIVHVCWKCKGIWLEEGILDQLAGLHHPTAPLATSILYTAIVRSNKTLEKLRD